MPVSSVAPDRNRSVTVFPGKNRVALIDAGIEEPDGHPGAGSRVPALQQLEVGVGPARIDVVQSPLVLETVLQCIVVYERLR